MCDNDIDDGPDQHDEDHQHDVYDVEGHHEEDVAIGAPHGHPSRRALLGGSVAALAAPLVLRGGAAAAATDVNAATGQRSYLAAMHMHASFSEQQGSWQGQAARMVEESVDLMFMTDHSHAQMASHMAADLTGVVLTSRTTGTASRSKATSNAGALSLLVQSATAAPATAAVLVDPDAKANRDAIRTSVMGQTLRHTFGAVSVAPGGLYEVRVQLSHHPATGGRPNGLYQLCYRFGPGLPVSRTSESRGLTQVFVQPLPASGVSVDLDLEGDAATAWPDLIPQDNGLQWVSFGVVSPAVGILSKVDVASVAFLRATRTPAAVRRVQQKMADRYATDFGIAIQPAVELGDTGHHSAFLDKQFFSADDELGYTDPAAYTKANVAAVHAAGGVISWNHPFGPTVGTPLTGTAEASKRHGVFRKLQQTDLYGADILEVGYGVRGSMGIESHMALWDTFSRNGRFLTANGVSDSHDSATSRISSGNEFATGIWADSVGTLDVVAGLAAGRAYTRHAGFWRGGTLDIVVDDTYTMGQVVVGSQSTRRLTLTAGRLPRGSVVEIIGGAVDYQGTDPGTTVVDRLAAGVFGKTGIASYSLTVPDSAFVRLTVRDRNGTVIGLSNPVWLLRTPPPGGIPAPRRP